MTKSQEAANEYAIEEVLSRFPHITERVLDLEEGSLTLANRQQSLPSGRSDLVFLSGSDVYLLELKAVPAKITHLDKLSGTSTTTDNQIPCSKTPKRSFQCYWRPKSVAK